MHLSSRMLLLLGSMLAYPAGVLAQSFDQTIAPLLIERCIDCHSGLKPKGKLDLTKKSAALRVVIARNPKDSVLWQRVEAGEMPPKKPLSAEEKAALKSWIERGAEWGSDPIDSFRVTTSKRAGNDWWALQPIKRPELPKVKQKAWPRNPIDQFILAKLEAEGLAPSPEAEPGVLVRRLWYDLLGLPPTYDEVSRFRAEHYDKLVARLLASPRHGERWARHWLDIVRFGESHGFEHDELRKNAWPYRDWVIDAFNKDMPFDEFARLQIAGDILKPTDPGAITATGFLVAGGYDSVGQSQQSAAMKAVVRQDELEDIVGTISQTFLGLTVQCARCHDHKFDPVRTEEYYRLAAAVAGVRHGERVIANVQRAKYEKEMAEIRKQLAMLELELAAIEKPVRAKILAERAKNGTKSEFLPKAIARWDFTKSLKDGIADIEAKLHGEASRKSDGLHLPGGTSYASTPPLDKAVGAKTLAVVVRLHNLTQRGGAAISVQTLDGQLFDAIVFGEREPGKWIAGSDFFRRTQDFGAAAETSDKPVHVAITYAPDGTIRAFRNGVLHGKPYQAKALQTFEAKKAMLLFGLRHSPAGGTKHLAGTLLKAELYDRPLSPSEVAAIAGQPSDYIADEEIDRQLDAESRGKRGELKEWVSQGHALLNADPPTNRVYVVTPKAPEPTPLLIRGNPGQVGPMMTPGGVASLKLPADFGLAQDATDADRRRKLAEWITHPQNPLLARVIVNRLWHYHFGVGLVDSPSDFGFNGGRPSHPELLDWLAAELMQRGWSLRHIHRLIVTSATYRQASRFRAEAAKLDAGNRWLWRKSPLRLEAEALRDGILSVAGQLNLQAGGPGYRDFNLLIRGATHYYNPADLDDPSVYRRSIYRTWARSGRNGLLDAHDCPDPSTVSPRRVVTTTPLQALSLMNGSFVLRMADRCAERAQKDAGDDVAKQIGRVYELAYGRRATNDEIMRVRLIVERHGLAVLCRAVFNSNEFVYVD